MTSSYDVTTAIIKVIFKFVEPSYVSSKLWHQVYVRIIDLPRPFMTKTTNFSLLLPFYDDVTALPFLPNGHPHFLYTFKLFVMLFFVNDITANITFNHVTPFNTIFAFEPRKNGQKKAKKCVIVVKKCLLHKPCYLYSLNFSLN